MIGHSITIPSSAGLCIKKSPGSKLWSAALPASETLSKTPHKDSPTITSHLSKYFSLNSA